MSDYEIERFEHAGRTVVICTDPGPANPREEFDHVAVLACWHRRARLGDEQISPMPEEELRETVNGTIVAMLPLYIYEHGGITMSCGAFSDPWDSGQVGWAYVTAEALDKDGWAADKRDTETLEALIRSEVAEYDQYLTGSVYGFRVLGLDDEHIDSCWGFYGDLDYVRAEAKSAAEASEDPAVEEAASELSGRATFAAGAVQS